MKMMNCGEMYVFLAIMVSLIGTVYQLDIKASYTTPFQCSDDSFALISGTNLTLEYDYGYNYSQLQSFHLYEVKTGRHMFDYEKLAGQAYVKDRFKRLQSYEWMNTGIKFTIPDIDKKIDLGKYQGHVETEQEYSKITIEIKEIFDPPAEVILNTSDSLKSVNVTEGFGDYVFEASAESYRDFTCNSAEIVWVSPAKGRLQSCHAKEERNATFCQLTLKESNMAAGECMSLVVYAEQYGVQSEKKACNVCYNVDRSKSSQWTAVVIGVIMFVIILVIILSVYWRWRKMKIAKQGSSFKKVKYSEASQAVDF